MPLHTGQSKKETVVHRPMEWSICKAYDEIYSQCLFAKAPIQLKLSSESDWLGKAILECAKIAHGHYDRIIDIYNLARGVVDPPRGLTLEARRILVELFDLAVGGWASALCRIAVDVDAPIPEANLSLPTVIAGIDMPRAWVVRKFTNAAEQKAVKQLFDEYAKYGDVVDNLPAEIKVVRTEREKDRQAELQREIEKSQPKVAPVAATPVREDTISPPIDIAPVEPPLQPTLKVVPPPEEIRLPVVEPLVSPRNQKPEEEVQLPMPVAEKKIRLDQPQKLAEARVPQVNADSAINSASVSVDSPLADAPSIGPKTAKRFAEIGIITIGDFLNADPSQLAEQLNTSWIKPELLADWQCQAHLVTSVPALCGYKAQLLVALKCYTCSDLASTDPKQLHSQIVRHCNTKEGQRILRSASIPSSTEVNAWVSSAQRSLQTV